MPSDIGKYQVREEIARGGMGVVYRVHDSELGRDLALKLLAVEATPSEKQLERFRRECQVVARLRHPNVVRIHDAGHHLGKPFFVQDLIEGPTLEDRLTRGPLPLQEAAQIVNKVADALQFVHERGVFHRDVKPSNILVAPHGPILIDFGLVKDTSLMFSKPSLTKTGMGLGTPGYWSPEQALGEKKGEDGESVGASSDIYSLGATLYALLTGRPPFEPRTALEGVLLAVNEAPQPPSRLRKDLPASLEAICLKCLEKAPGDRYGTAGELAADLRRYLAGERVRALNRRPSPWLVVVALVLGVVGVVAAVLATTRPRGEEQVRPVPVAPDTIAPVLSLTSPLDGSVVNRAQAVLRGRVEDASAVEVSASGAKTVTVSPQEILELSVPLKVGVNELAVNSVDSAGNTSEPRLLRVLCPPSTNSNADLLPGFDQQSGSYVIDTTITIGPTQTVVLGPGSTLRFATGAGIECEGQLWCVGTPASMVRFSPLEPVLDLRAEDARGWNGVRAKGIGAVVVLGWTRVEGATPNTTTAALLEGGSGNRTAKALRKLRGGALTVLDGAKVYLSDSVLRNSRPPRGNRGGGLHAEGTKEQLTEIYVWRTRFEECWAKQGGGARVGPHVKAYIRDSAFAGNGALRGSGFSADGGGGDLSFEGVRFVKNSSEHYGGGVFVERSARFDACLFQGNRARERGGGFLAVGQGIHSSLSGVRFEENQTEEEGGGAYFYGRATLRDCKFVRNTAAAGGAFESETEAVITLEGCTFEGNTPPHMR